MADAPTVIFLRDTLQGGDPDQAKTVAHDLAEFAAAATTSLDVAIHDFRLTDPGLTSTVVDALTGAADRGVTVRIGYDAGKPAAATAATFAALQADPAAPGTAEWVSDHFRTTAVAVEAITAGTHLMHSKYIVRDAPADASPATGSPAVWTGSTNFTDDAWTRQENNIVILPGDTAAAEYRQDFDQLWTAAAITGTGAHDRGVPLSGIYDGGQMDAVVAQDWEPTPIPPRYSPIGAPSRRTWPARSPLPTPRPACTTSCTSRY